MKQIARVIAVAIVSLNLVAADGSIKKPEALQFVEEAEAAAKKTDLEESFKCYKKAAMMEDTIALHRRMAHFYFDLAEKTKNDNLPAYEASLARWNAAKKGAVEKHRYLVGGETYKFNPNNAKYQDASTKHKAIADVIQVCFPLYDKASEGFNAIIRLAKNGRDFDAAGYKPLCLASQGDVELRMRTRQLINEFLIDYKGRATNATEEALYKRNQDTLEKMNK